MPPADRAPVTVQACRRCTKAGRPVSDWRAPGLTSETPHFDNLIVARHHRPVVAFIDHAIRHHVTHDSLKIANPSHLLHLGRRFVVTNIVEVTTRRGRATSWRLASENGSGAWQVPIARPSAPASRRRSTPTMD